MKQQLLFSAFVTCSIFCFFGGCSDENNNTLGAKSITISEDMLKSNKVIKIN